MDDSRYHPFDRAGHRHMEYVNERGSFDDLPLEQIVVTFAEVYPEWSLGTEPGGADFATDAARENSR